MRYSITLSYDGSSFSGWQIQPNAPSVQEALESALSLALREKVTVTGAGRTDAGVNACGYVAHFDAADDIDTAALGCKLNAILPVFVRIHEVKIAEPEFHARFDARYRRYNYFIHRSKDPFVRHYSYLYTFPLDVDAMNEACKLLLGTHDFSCFEKTGGNSKTSICTVFEASWQPYEPTHVRIMGYPRGGCSGQPVLPTEAGPLPFREPMPACPDSRPLGDDYLVFTIAADRFLRNMVRAVVGTLLDIGRGRYEPSHMAEVLASQDRCAAGESVPGHALFLSSVKY